MAGRAGVDSRFHGYHPSDQEVPVTTNDYIDDADFSVIRQDLRRQAMALHAELSRAGGEDVASATGRTVLAIARALDGLLRDAEERRGTL